MNYVATVAKRMVFSGGTGGTTASEEDSLMDLRGENWYKYRGQVTVEARHAMISPPSLLVFYEGTEEE